MKIVVLSGGVGGAKFAQGIQALFAEGASSDDESSAVTLVVNTADDFVLSGLKICPDLDSVLYALAGVNDATQGWGRANESLRVQQELDAFGAGWPWFKLGDLDIATHIARTGWLADGLTLTEVTKRLSERFSLSSLILPMTDDRVETQVQLESQSSLMPFEEWWVRYRGELHATGFLFEGAETARPAPGVLSAIQDADVVFFAPSNPIVSIGPILAVPGIREAVQQTEAAVIGVSPIIDGAPVRGMAAQCLEAEGVACTALGVADFFGSRKQGGLLDGWLIANEDAASLAAIHNLGMASAATELWMRTPKVTAEIVQAALALARGKRP